MSDNTEILNLSREQQNQLIEELGNLLKEKFSLQQSLREQLQTAQAANEELFLDLLEVFDALEFLLNYTEENPEPNPQFYKRLPKSIASVQKKLLSILKRRKVELIEFQETQPDFNICRVVDSEVRDDVEEHNITKIVRQGFCLEEKVLRPIEVITARKE